MQIVNKAKVEKKVKAQLTRVCAAAVLCVALTGCRTAVTYRALPDGAYEVSTTGRVASTLSRDGTTVTIDTKKSSVLRNILALTGLSLVSGGAQVNTPD